MKSILKHIALLIDDYDRAIAYYTRVLGFDLTEDTDLGMGKRWVVVSPPGASESGASLLLARAANPQQQAAIGNQSGGRVFLFLHTDHFDRDYEHLIAEGVTFTREPEVREYGKVAVFQDLYGNLWDLIERGWGREAKQGSGGFSEKNP